ncbi:hypothetical protein P280DRAFT_367209, partial [Massarina eburnea CBS 473.64]
NFTGTGNIFVLNSSDVRTATPDSKVGCIDADGKFINPESNDVCGVFTLLKGYPYTLSSPNGNCTWNDKTQEANTESTYGSGDHGWHCFSPYEGKVGESLYTIKGFPYTFLCNGDVNCFYDAKKIPASGSTDRVSLWPFRWGSQQLGITPGHVQLQLLWNKL